MTHPLLEAARPAAQLVRNNPGRWFIACDVDADGLAAAAVAAAALRRAGRPFQVRASRGKSTADHEATLREASSGIIFLDKGTSHAAMLARHARDAGRSVIVLDHHNLPSDASEAHADAFALVNPRAIGLDGGRDASAATVAVAFALALGGPANLDLAPIGLSGAIGDWQHEGGWQGWNAQLVQDAQAAGHLTRRRQPRLVGASLAEALARERLPGVDDRATATRFLEDLGLPAHVHAEDLDAAAGARVVSALVLRALQDPESARRLDPARLVEDALWNPRLDTSLRDAFRVADACGRSGQAALGISYLLGDPAARADALACDRAFRTRLGAALDRLRAEGTQRRAHLQVAWTDEAALTGMVGGIGMTVLLQDVSVPLAVLAKRDDGAVQVSTRATQAQVAAGMDLGKAVHAAARAAGEEGGGHPIAAGAVVSPHRVETFLAALDAALGAKH